EGADLLGVEVLVVDLGLPVGAHVALDRTDGAVDVGDRLALGDFTDEHLARLGEGDDRGRRTRTLGVGDDGGLAALEDRDDAVRRAEVDSDSTCHGVTSVRLMRWRISGRPGESLCMRPFCVVPRDQANKLSVIRSTSLMGLNATTSEVVPVLRK